jgi:hypothetical protein
MYHSHFEQTNSLLSPDTIQWTRGQNIKQIHIYRRQKLDIYNINTCKLNTLKTNVVDDLAFSVKSLIIVVYYYKTCVSLHNLDESMSVLSVERDNLLSLTNVCKTYIQNTKQIRTNCISRKVWDDRFWNIIIDSLKFK